MEYSILLEEDAENDLEEAYNWYEQQQPGLGLRLIQSLEKAYRFISQYPRASNPQHRQIYRYVMKKFPFGIYYLLDESHSEVLIIGILHFKLNPKILQKRIKS